MPFLDAILLAGAAFAAGALNSVAGGGSFLTFPALLLVGVGPLEANATSTIALWPGSVAAATAYRRELRAERRLAIQLLLVSLVGGGAGALLLVKTPPETFVRLVPWLLLAATLVFTFGPRLQQHEAATATGSRRLLVVAIQLPIAVYGGYFGGGIGLMMLAALTLIGMVDIHRMNALKMTLGAAINSVAVVTFIVARLVAWAPALVMVVGAIAGGYGGAALARRLPPRPVRRFVVVLGWAMTLYFFTHGAAADGGSGTAQRHPAGAPTSAQRGTSMIVIEQLLSGRDFGKQNPGARQMANFSYLVSDDVSKECMLVDPTWDIAGLLEHVRTRGLKLVGAVVTHGHPDHCGGHLWGTDIEGAALVAERASVPVYVHELDAPAIVAFGVPEQWVREVHEGDKVPLGGAALQVLHTPGHTPGGMCIRAGDGVLTGDTLFVGECGRVDLPGSDADQMWHSLRRLAALPENVVVYPGHDYGASPTSTIGEQKRTNRCLKLPGGGAGR